jgi:hypothetical protein
MVATSLPGSRRKSCLADRLISRSAALAIYLNREEEFTPRLGTIKRLSFWVWLPFASRRVLQDTFTPHRSLNWKKTR